MAKLHGSEWERAEGSEEKERESEKGKEKQKVYAARAMKKAERQAEIRRKYEQWKAGRGERYTVGKKVCALTVSGALQGTNIYVKNLAATVDESELKKQFGPYGQIRNVKVHIVMIATT